MKLISFNVNGIRARLHQLKALIDKHSPDVIGLQETKVEDSLFPEETINAWGYQTVFHGQKGHYGVALLYKKPLLSSACGLPEDGEDAQRRLVRISLDTTKGPIHIYNGYFPQGENRSHQTKFASKSAFYADLRSHLTNRHATGDQVVVMGDMNVAPYDVDIGIGDENRKRWLREGKCCFLPEEREWLSALNLSLGLEDTFHSQHVASGDYRYSWFDYRSKGFERDPRRGLRIDLILATEPLMDCLVDTGVDHDIRAMERPSDHCPVWASFDLT